VTGFQVVIPSQGFERGKSRLAPVLGPDERRAFSRKSFLNVLRAARLAAGARNVIVVSGSAPVLGLSRRAGAVGLVEKRRHLNASVEAAVRLARRRRHRAVVVIHGDLPHVTARDIRLLVWKLAGVALAPDRMKSGTNAVAVAPGVRFRFRFGADSFRRHRSESRRSRTHARVVQTQGLASDIDTPEDYLSMTGTSFPRV
jgi:2-phospho-L-lactate/phosphoenolpyruvate guanylyltransferase